MSIERYYTSIDPGGASGIAAYFDNPTNISSTASSYQETENIVGAAGATVTLQVTIYTVTNYKGTVIVKGGIEVQLGDQFTVVLDGTGNGSFAARCEGDAGDTGTIVRAQFAIVGVSIGQIGSPNTRQISKTF